MVPERKKRIALMQGHGAKGSSRAKLLLELAQHKNAAASKRPFTPPKRSIPCTTPSDSAKKQCTPGEHLHVNKRVGALTATGTDTQDWLASGAGALPATPIRRKPAPGTSFLRQNATFTQLKNKFAEQQLAKQEVSGALQFRRQILGAGSQVAGTYAMKPIGLVNLGNTCYLNAVLQVLLSLPGFVSDLRLAQQRLGGLLPDHGVAAALMECIATRESSSNSTGAGLAPVSLKKAMGERLAAFQGSFQQDAHEFLCGLLEALQEEVLQAEGASSSRAEIPISETTDPAARSFSFTVRHDLTCTLCQHSSHVVEEYMHLSLELPTAGQPQSIVPPDVKALLASYFQKESLEKRCEKCGAQAAPHTLEHTLGRLPRVLALHLKRFQVSFDSQDGTPSCHKLQTAVELPPSLQLPKQLLGPSTRPPLPPRTPPLLDRGKENSGHAANRGGGPSRADPAGAMGGHSMHDARSAPSHGLPGLRGLSFYSGGAGCGEHSAPWHLASPVSTTQRAGTLCDTRLAQITPPRRGAATPLQRVEHGGETAAPLEQEDAELQRVLELSAQEFRNQQQQQQYKGQQREGAEKGMDLPSPPSERGRVDGAGEAGGGEGGGADEARGGTPRYVAISPLPPTCRWEGPSGGSSSVQEQRDLQLALQLSLREAQPVPQAPALPRLPLQQAARGEHPDPAHAPSLFAPNSVANLFAEAMEPGDGQVDRQQAEQLPGGAPTAGGFPGWGGDENTAAEAGRAWPPCPGGETGAAPMPDAQPHLPRTGQLQEEQQQVQGRGLEAWGVGAQQQQCMVRLVEDSKLGKESSGVGCSSAACASQPVSQASLPVQYSLHSLVNHSGPSALCGHFTADVCDVSTGAWHRWAELWGERGHCSRGGPKGAERKHVCVKHLRLQQLLTPGHARPRHSLL